MNKKSRTENWRNDSEGSSSDDIVDSFSSPEVTRIRKSKKFVRKSSKSRVENYFTQEYGTKFVKSNGVTQKKLERKGHLQAAKTVKAWPAQRDPGEMRKQHLSRNASAPNLDHDVVVIAVDDGDPEFVEKSEPDTRNVLVDKFENFEELFDNNAFCMSPTSLNKKTVSNISRLTKTHKRTRSEVLPEKHALEKGEKKATINGKFSSSVNPSKRKGTCSSSQGICIEEDEAKAEITRRHRGFRKPRCPEGFSWSLGLSDKRAEQWIYKHEPKSESDLLKALNKTVVCKVRSWIEDSLKGRENQLLILTGPCGSGKSSCIKVLADCLGISVRSWKSETDCAFTANFFSDANGFQSTDLHLPYVSKLDDFAQCIRNARYPRLSIGTEENSTLGPNMLLIDSLPNIKSNDETKLQKFHGIIRGLIADVPPKRKMILSVIIVSDQSDASNPTFLRQKFSDAVITSTRTTILQFPAVPPTRLKRVLLSIATMEDIDCTEQELEEIAARSKGDLRNAIQSLQFFGAMENKRKTFEVNRSENMSSTAVTEERSIKDSGVNGFERDFTYTLNHAIGKLIRANTVGESYDSLSKAKKLKYGPKPIGAERRQLNFTPEDVADSCPLEPEAILAFMQHNCPAHFASIQDLSRTFDYFCMADVLLGSGSRMDQRPWQYKSTGTTFPGAYVVSLSSRAVAASREQRSDAGFPTIVAPRVWKELQRRELEKAQQIERFRGFRNFNTANCIHIDYATLGRGIHKHDHIPGYNHDEEESGPTDDEIED